MISPYASKILLRWRSKQTRKSGMFKLSGRVVDLSRKRPMSSIDENKSSRKTTNNRTVSDRYLCCQCYFSNYFSNDELCLSFAIEKSNVPVPERIRKFHIKFRTRLMRYPYTQICQISFKKSIFFV